MTKENLPDGGLERIARVNLESGQEVPLTPDFADIPSDVYGQFSDRTKELLKREDIQVVVDYTGQVFVRKMDDKTLFDVMYKRYMGGGEHL